MMTKKQRATLARELDGKADARGMVRLPDGSAARVEDVAEQMGVYEELDALMQGGKVMKRDMLSLATANRLLGEAERAVVDARHDASAFAAALAALESARAERERIAKALTGSCR